MRNGSAKVCPQCNEVKHLAEFRDSSLVTGIGRFCLSCKTAPKIWRHAALQKKHVNENEPTKKDINKLLTFSENPEKYATGTARAKEKVSYLESVKHLFSEGQLATYDRARAKYDATLGTVAVKNRPVKKVDYTDVLNEAYTQHKSLKIRYKGVCRTIDPYSLNNVYVSGYCHKARDMRTFRIDRMQGAEVSDSFDFDRSIQTTALRKMTEAPRYRGSRH